MRIILVEHAASMIPEPYRFMGHILRGHQTAGQEICQGLGIAGINFSPRLDHVEPCARQKSHDICGAILKVRESYDSKGTSVPRSHFLQVFDNIRSKIIITAKDLNDHVGHIRKINLKGIGLCHKISSSSKLFFLEPIRWFLSGTGLPVKLPMTNEPGMMISGSREVIKGILAKRPENTAESITGGTRGQQ
jgi:hypothetical protein